MATSGSFLSGAVAVALAASAHAAPPTQPDAAMLLRELQRLETVGRVLYVAAHPDDENTRLLAWLVGEQHVRAAYLSLTRGEGGQNLIGSEQAPLLGLIRTHELLAARAIDGAEQLFGRERDFGYSKSADETLALWGHDEALADVVWAIRLFRPDVIVTRFSPEDHETHGHHTASAMLALEAFRLAADPKAYPEQLAQVQPWQAKRIVWNKGVFGPAKPEELTGFVKLDVGSYDALRGESYGELAARSRSMHKSQGFGVAPQRGPAPEYFRVLAGEPMQGSFLDGVDLSWARVKGSERLRAQLAKVRAGFKPEDPSASVPALLEALADLDALPDNPWKAEKREALSRVIAACAGLYLDATASEPTATPGGEVKLTLSAINRSAVPLSLASVRLGSEDVAVGKPLAAGAPWSLERPTPLPREAPLSTPYWLAHEPVPGRWSVTDMSVLGQPEGPPALEATFVLEAGKQRLELRRPVVYAWVDPVAGERRRPLEVLPAVTVNPREPLRAFPDAQPREVRVVARASRGAASGAVRAEAPAGFAVEPASQAFKLEAGAEQELVFKVKPPAKLAEGDSATGALRFSVAPGEGAAEPAHSVTRVEYPHIPIQTIVAPAQVKLVRFEMKRALTRIGYIPGAGDEVASALRQVGYEVTVLGDEALAHEPLAHYEAIVVGVRAFNTNPRLPAYHQRLMDYVAQGGTLVVQYNTQNRISKLVGPIGPFPFNISQDRVTDETAPATLLEPKHSAFTAPNRLVDADWSGWVQERGLYFADTWDPKYTPLLGMHDPKEPERKGALLWARHGKGVFVYTGLAFFRQLPAGVPGAYRLLANLLSHGH